MANLKPYPQTKDSGIEWLGGVPGHWEMLPGRHCFTEHKRPNLGMLEDTVLSLSYGDVVVKPPEKLHGLVPESFEGYQIIEPGDIVIRPTDLQNDWNSLRFGFSRVRGIITSAYLCLRARGALNPRFAHLILHSYDLMKIFYGLGSGLRQNLDWGDFKYLPCVAPPHHEQEAIVRYLDHVDGRVRRAVQAKRRLISLLQEQKQAVIHRAVTRGLNPDAPLKPSGVPWLGDIPEHWEVRRTKLVFSRIVGGSTPSSTNESYWDGPIVWVTPADISKTDRIRDSQRRITQVGLDSCSAELLPPDTLVVTSRAPVGNIALAEVPFCTNQGCKSLVPDEGAVHPIYSLYMFGSLQEELQNLSNGTTFMELSAQELGDMPLPLPPLPEQKAITEYLNRATANTAAAIAQAEREIKLLNEYRTRLIADVVTGKVDVREAAAGLPEVAPPEGDDEPGA